MRRIGVRELRQNASLYLRLVKQGETIEVTDRGVAVARLTPLPKNEADPDAFYEQLIREGKIRPGTQDWGSWKPIAPTPGERPLSAILQEMRDEDER
jgi:prevent-host-death family protein